MLGHVRGHAGTVATCGSECLARVWNEGGGAQTLVQEGDRFSGSGRVVHGQGRSAKGVKRLMTGVTVPVQLGERYCRADLLLPGQLGICFKSVDPLIGSKPTTALSPNWQRYFAIDQTGTATAELLDPYRLE